MTVKPGTPGSKRRREMTKTGKDARQECVHCGCLRRMAEGTVWCAKCLAWYRRELEVEWERENLGRQA